jgi:subtilisin family serine protease
MGQSVVIFAALVALAPLAGKPAAAVYDDTTCRTTAVSWTNDPCAGRQWGLTKIKAPEAWRITQGEGIRVAVVDTGADFGHPDLAPNLIAVPGADLTQNNLNRCPWMQAPGQPRTSSALAQDDNGHGTHVAGIIAAVTHNGRGVAGVARGAEVLPVKVLDASGSGSDVDVARGICFAADNGAKVINLSLGFDPVTSIIIQGLGNETGRAIEYAYAKGAAVIIAAGNETFPACDFPASHAQALCVGAVDERDVKAWYSNFGANVGVVAPGGVGSVFCNDDGDVWSTLWPGAEVDCGQDGYEPLAGTSMAAPHVAAVAALLASGNPGATPDFLYAKLRSTADDLGTPGVDPVFGYGRVNALRAVTE